ncbi:cation-translocating P-type ATPase [Agrilutibacter solisilvae]|uniref:Cation-translocating P-type ATPase n=1 Tax=Agrilutibacter solisilvae TaxID=2763317 RepID=A0A975AS12_9GAMM|nr:cation-translocating P-type ATPase [Lysobacter solisilvae]QSX77768.1 cation-translocating P-type ATPase [Lysobacter solisilvae]
MNATAPNPEGLTTAEAVARQRRDGPNLLPQPDRRNGLRIVWSVLREPMLLLLIGACALYLLLGDAQEALVLAASVVLVVGLTVYQEYRSERALQALRELSSPRARVLRDGQTRLLAARELVVGDVIFVTEGDRVPADSHVLTASDLMLDESMLTGESAPVRRPGSPEEDADSALIRASTLVVRGNGTAQVVAIGVHTAVGQIGQALRTLRSPPTPMEREMRRAVGLFAVLGIASSVVLTLLYVAVHGNWLSGLLAGVTLAMANIPEEFPVVLTVFLALGAWRMAGHRALVRRAPAIEALGSVTVLCTDKTGTLTQNRMTLAELVTDQARATPSTLASRELEALLDCADLASADEPFDPMERAIRTAAAPRPSTRDRRTRVREYPFSSELLAVTHVWRRALATGLEVACKGAPEVVAGLCNLPAETRSVVLAQADEMARRGLRVIAAASTVWNEGERSLPATARGFNLEWRGLLGLADPLRPGVAGAVADAQAAGVRVVMLTGDHLETARAIAAQAGITQDGRIALGSELEALDPATLAEYANHVDVFARVKPDHKLRLVNALKDAGQVVAMTGDGVNDAPALMSAHVGVAMGERGTDVAREAASIVLLDDNFVTVVRAIRQGRCIYDNILSAVRYILAVHVPITGLALLPLLFGGTLILMPLHIVFLELIIDPASTLVFEGEPAAADVMRRPPRPPSQRLLDIPTLVRALGQGLAVFALVTAIYLLGRSKGIATPELSALSFTALVAGNLGLIVVNLSRKARSHWWRIRNPAFWMVALSALGLLMIVTRLQGPGNWFGFAPPSWEMTILSLVLPLVGLALLEAARVLWTRRRVAVTAVPGSG